jgi:hypothetical protein
LIRPDKHLRDLIASASPEQNARAMVKARNYFNACHAMGIEPGEAARILREALQMEIDGNAADVADDGKSKDDFYTRRRFQQNYTE